MIRVRLDDVLINSDPMGGRELQKFQKHVNWAYQAPDHFTVAPAILCTEIQQFPDCIEYLKDEIQSLRMFPDLHGWEHIDYSKLTTDEIKNHLTKSIEFFNKHFGVLPTRWCTPWGADSKSIRQAAREFNISVETTSLPVIDQGKAVNVVRNFNSIQPLTDKVIMVHFWERGLKLYRIVQVAKYGSWTAAAAAQPEYFK